LALVKEVTQDLGHVEVVSFTGLLCDFVHSQGARVIVRGLRSVTDYDYETQMAGMNRHLAPEVDTIFLHTSASVQHISSTLVREISTLGGKVDGLVSPAVLKALQAKR
jgi:pantetheine-phosphate adenylyltransferase